MTLLPPLDAGEFGAAFMALHGVEPFPWQVALAENVCRDGMWPSLLDLPTGSGKTAALDIALFHLAVEADRGSARRAPLRIALVVDRRLVVDGTFARAQRIEKALRDAPEKSVLGRMAARLRYFAGPGAPAVVAHRLRGGLPLEADWARTPCQPLLVASTVDQIGSRLLFRGYGVSDRMKPVHAALVGSDCLILIDEAHLAEPFRQTLTWVGHYRTARTQSGADPWGFAVLTATPGSTNSDRFGLTEAERTAAPGGSTPAGRLRKRLTAEKPARLIAPTKDIVAHVVDQATAMLADLRQSGIEKPAIGVIVNRVARARDIHQKLEAHFALADEKADVALLIGPSRPLDRDQIVEKLEPIATGAERGVLPGPLIVVATQCLEVGADLDFDGLVTECASLDALRQRFGRLNRAGRDVQSSAAILIQKSDEKPKKDGDPVYGFALAETWKWLNTKASDNGIDFGIEAMERLLDSEQDAARLFASKPDAPVLCPAHLDLLLTTSPLPEPDLDIGLFLHGPQRASADISLVWRADLTEEDLANDARARAKEYLETLAVLPPRVGEILRVPIWAARQFLEQGGEVTDLADLPQAEHSPDSATRGSKRRAIRWAGRDQTSTGVVTAEDLRPGDVVVLPADYGGCDRFGWNPASVLPVSDLAHRAAEPYRSRTYAVRLHANLIAGVPVNATDAARSLLIEERQQIASALCDLLGETAADTGRALVKNFVETAPKLSLDAETARRLQAMSSDTKGPIQLLRREQTVKNCEPETFAVTIVAPHGLKELDTSKTETAALPATEDDAIGLSSGEALLLDRHCDDVERLARNFATAVGLGPEQTDDIALAAFLHDAGKIDPRFQTLLAGGRSWNRDPDRILAKSGRAISPPDWEAARKAAGLPPKWRHEALSVALAPQHPRFIAAHDAALVLHLIGTHHGHGRPWFPHDDGVNDRGRELFAKALGLERWTTAQGPQHPQFDRDGLDWPSLVAELQSRYGPWRLALMEAILRLADHRASEAADEAATASSPARKAAE